MAQNYGLPTTDQDAKLRANRFKDEDPFPSIPRALLSSAEIYDYARVTGMLFPFYAESLAHSSDGDRLIQPMATSDSS